MSDSWPNPNPTGITPTVTPVPSPASVPEAPLPSAVMPAVAFAQLSLRQSTEIQGNILAGFLKDHQIFVFLKFPDQSRARQWLNELLPRVAKTKEVAEFNQRFSAARKANGGDDPENLQSKWVNIGVTFSGLTILSSPSVLNELTTGQGFTAFVEGPAKRAPLLGDVAPNSDPSRWVVGGPDQTQVDAMLTVAADDPDDMLVEMEKLRALATKYGLTTVFEQRGNTLPGERAGHEHFGFKDGISQPGVRGFDRPGDPAQNSADGQDHTNEVAGKPGTDLIMPGEFVLGYPRQNPQGSSDPQPAWPCPPWMQNGSFQVWRRLEQDVPGFWAQVTTQLKTASLPSDDPMTEDMLAAKLMGRWRSGTPTDLAPDDDNRSARDPKDDNNFEYNLHQSLDMSGSQPQKDTEGLQCPLDAHTRKMYPRNPNTGDEQRRIIRRGIPFGLPFDPAAGRGHGVDADRGLLFMAFMSNIEQQFELLQGSWADSTFPGGNAGPDPVIGIFPGTTEATHTINRTGRPPLPLTLQRFVHTMGAVYAFAPSITTLKALATGAL